ncbi:MAG: hypothetical protein V2A66_00200 [Pseudomonadota bacterium]
MEKAQIAVLRADVNAQLVEIERIYARIEERARGKGPAELEGLSYWLHNLYCAFEDIFKLVAAAFENHVSMDGGYHVELLKRMSVSIEGVRPALISADSRALFDNLRAFRHLLRHAYMYDLDERKVRAVFEDATKLKALYRRDINSFFNQI